MTGGRMYVPYGTYFMLADIRMNSAGERKRWRQDNYQHKADGMKKHRKRREIAERIKDGAGR